MKPGSSETSDANLNKPSTLKPSDPRGQNSHPELPTVAADTQPSNLKHSLLHSLANAGKESLVASLESCGKSFGTSKEHVTKLKEALVEEKASLNRKGSTGNSKRDMLRQKTFHFEKSYKGRMSKGAFKAKLTSWGSMVLDKSLKSPSGSSGVVMKSTYSKITTSIGPNASLPEGAFSVSSNSSQGANILSVKETVFALPAVNSKKAPPSAPEDKSSPKAENNSSSTEVPDYYAGIPYDDSLGKYVPRDDKEETILILVSHMKALQKDIEVWKDWANEKIMQATRRLSKDQVELKMLRQEKEEADKFKKEMPALEEGSMKRLSEMEHAISNAAAQIEAANASIHRLEEENNVLKSEAEDARLQTLRASANLTEAVLKEQEALKRCQLGDTEKVSLQEELATLKHRLAELQQLLEKAELRKNQIEALWKQEDKERLKYQGQAELLRKETEQVKAQTKADEDTMRETDERNSRQCMEEIKKLEREISELRLESESSRIAELLGSVDISNYGSGGLVGNKMAQGFQVPLKVNKRLAVFQDNFGAGGSISPDRECVMCLTAEMSVVFVPCAHQVLCVECNALHEKQGMHDCPSCRTPIQKRIAVRYINNPEHHHL
ncbi:OLC1v1007419C1 [Oldenlandia corymbosa var. corymbosa]|uniref:OLC1v1007419C1 n=1 Tax=Oldenlandia corymbosa var. corymbosa TaxID=529605 RepID=A0AAV1DLV1_OLDCO|nr:OLC1v1007419C1 [Oldenlandia corymbosa var. corymbosa]